jgi:hypothetical protein
MPLEQCGAWKLLVRLPPILCQYRLLMAHGFQRIRHEFHAGAACAVRLARRARRLRLNHSCAISKQAIDVIFWMRSRGLGPGENPRHGRPVRAQIAMPKTLVDAGVPALGLGGIWDNSPFGAHQYPDGTSAICRNEKVSLRWPAGLAFASRTLPGRTPCPDTIFTAERDLVGGSIQCIPPGLGDDAFFTAWAADRIPRT